MVYMLRASLAPKKITSGLRSAAEKIAALRHLVCYANWGTAGGLIAFATLGFSPVAAKAGRSVWNSSFGQGNMEYLAGQWDATTGSALLLNCSSLDQTASMAVQIAGKEPPPGSFVHLEISRAGNTQKLQFRTTKTGSTEFGRAATSPALRQLWTTLRSGDTVTIRYADGRSSTQSLKGATRALPVRPCGSS